MTDGNQIEAAAEPQELTTKELNDVSGGNIIVGILASIYSNAVYDALTGERRGIFSQYHDAAKRHFK